MYINLNRVLCYCKCCKELFDLKCVVNLIKEEIRKVKSDKDI